MAKNKVHARNNLVVDLPDHYSGRERSASPISIISRSEAIEMKDMSGDTPSKMSQYKKDLPGGVSDHDQTSSFVDTQDDYYKDKGELKYPGSISATSPAVPGQISVMSAQNSINGDETDSTSASRRKSGRSDRHSQNDGVTSTSPAPRQISVISFHNDNDGYVSKSSGDAWGSTNSGKSSYTDSDNSRGTSYSRELSDLSLLKQDTSFSPAQSAQSGVSNELEEDEFEYFCVDHMKLCSNKEITEGHSDCENVVSAYEWADAQKMENDRKGTESLLKRFDSFAGIMIDERGDFKRQLTESREDATDDFLDMVEDMITHLLAKQKQFILRLDELHESNLKSINEQIKRCKKVQNETSRCLKQLSECIPGSDKYKQLKKKIEDKCPVYEEILRRDFNAATRLDYEFVPDPEAEDLMTKLKRLGDIVVRMKPSKLPAFLSQSTETEFTKRGIEDICRNEGLSSSDQNSCCFSGAIYISHGRMMLADWNNACVKMFSKKGVLMRKLELPNNPWDIKPLDENTAVVTVPGEQKIFLIEHTRENLHIVSTFDTDCECWGVVPVDGKLAMTCDPWSKTPSVKLFTKSGKLLSFFQKDSKGKLLFKYPEHITADVNETTLYVSDSRNHTVLAITLNGRTLFRYRNAKLVSPAGVTTDCQGNLYVCGKDSQNVHQVSKDGQLVRILFDQHDIESPRAICFQPNGENILVTDVASNNCDDFLTGKFL